MNYMIYRNNEKGLTESEIRCALEDSLKGINPKRVLIIPPDGTRLHSMANVLTNIYYELLKGCDVDIMPALGTHVPMSCEEITDFFGDLIPKDKFKVHNWRNDIVRLGEVPRDYIFQLSEGVMNEGIAVEVNKRIMDGGYDLILSIGQVVPHEVVGMANYTKNIFVGCGGSEMINKTHMLGALFGIERVMGQIDSPVRKVFDYAERFIKHLPIIYVQTVIKVENSCPHICSLSIGRDRDVYEMAARDSMELNITWLDEPLKTCVVYLDEREFHSLWLGNKAVYRTRKAMADGGKLIIVAPGAERFGEDNEIDRLIRSYGYCGREKVLAAMMANEDLRNNQSAAAHLMHGSSEGRFEIIYAPGRLTKEEIEAVGYKYMPIEQAISRYKINSLKDGLNHINDESVFFISNPALGLWSSKI